MRHSIVMRGERTARSSAPADSFGLGGCCGLSHGEVGSAAARQDQRVCPVGSSPASAETEFWAVLGEHVELYKRGSAAL